MRLLFCLFFSCISMFAFAQGKQVRTCGTDAYMQAIQLQSPQLKQQYQLTRQAIQQTLKKKPTSGKNSQTAKVSIPVVFHVVYNTPAQNISDEQLYSQLAILNADFSRTNADARNTPSYFADLAADAGIEFCLASIDPAGDPTNGITRTQTSKEAFNSFSDNVKFSSLGGKDAWDSSEYLNIWVCNIEGRYLGYATYPGLVFPSRDGVVLLYTSVGASPANNADGPYNLGRTATHEVGHWLGLNHLWGSTEGSDDCPGADNDDGISDTPAQSKATFGCPGGIVVSCNNGPNGNMWQNYMDYSDDACMNLFTKGQAAYMNATISAARSSLFSSLACTGELRANFKTEAPEDTLIKVGNSVQFVDAYEGARPNNWLWEFEGGEPATSTLQNPIVTYSKPGKYSVKLTSSNGRMTSTTTKTDYVYVTSEEVRIYPVPASDYIIVEQPAREETRHIQLISHLGQLILSQKMDQRVIRLKVGNLKPGVYFLKVRNATGTTTRKVVIAR